nr:inositol monophosphatase [Marinomonas ostreistagni]
MTRDQKNSLIEIVRNVAKQEILPRFRDLSSDNISTKSGFDDLVTVADLAAEKAMTEAFSVLLPDALIVGEESVAADASVLDKIDSDELVLIIDPIDGTWNYANGLPTFGVLIAAAYAGQTIFGLLYDVANDDWIEASQGEGTWFVRANGDARQITIRTEVADDNLVGMFSPFLFKDESLRRHAALLQPKYARTIALRCCCHEYRTMVQGNVDFSVSPKPNVWDHAAGILAYQEAGGKVEMLDGSDYRPTIREGVIIAGRNAEVIARIRADFCAFLK